MGSKAAPTSADRHLDLLRTVLASTPWGFARSAMKYFQVGAFEAGGAVGADLLLVGEDGDEGFMGIFGLQGGFQRGEGADPVVLAVEPTMLGRSRCPGP